MPRKHGGILYITGLLLAVSTTLACIVLLIHSTVSSGDSSTSSTSYVATEEKYSIFWSTGASSTTVNSTLHAVHDTATRVKSDESSVERLLWVPHSREGFGIITRADMILQSNQLQRRLNSIDEIETILTATGGDLDAKEEDADVLLTAQDMKDSPYNVNVDKIIAISDMTMEPNVGTNQTNTSISVIAFSSSPTHLPTATPASLLPSPTPTGLFSNVPSAAITLANMSSPLLSSSQPTIREYTLRPIQLLPNTTQPIFPPISSQPTVPPSLSATPAPTSSPTLHTLTVKPTFISPSSWPSREPTMSQTSEYSAVPSLGYTRSPTKQDTVYVTITSPPTSSATTIFPTGVDIVFQHQQNKEPKANSESSKRIWISIGTIGGIGLLVATVLFWRKKVTLTSTRRKIVVHTNTLISKTRQRLGLEEAWEEIRFDDYDEDNCNLCTSRDNNSAQPKVPVENKPSFTSSSILMSPFRNYRAAHVYKQSE